MQTNMFPRQQLDTTGSGVFYVIRAEMLQAYDRSNH
jgi:hypothetical protein